MAKIRFILDNGLTNEFEANIENFGKEWNGKIITEVMAYARERYDLRSPYSVGVGSVRQQDENIKWIRSN